MSKNNSLIDIAKILIDIKEERDFPKVPKEIKDRFPEGSIGININDEKWFVINTPENSVVDEAKNEVKDYEKLKYNSNFYFGTTGKEEVEIIDFTHNKGILINEAYTEVSFLPKDILSEADFNRELAKKSVEIIIDKAEIAAASSLDDMFGNADSDAIFQYSDFDVSEQRRMNYFTNKEVFDNVYRLRCVFNDIAGNEMLASILIKAYKVSGNDKDGGYRYEIIDNETVKAEIDKLEQTDNKKGKRQTSFSTIDESGYEEIRNRIEEGLLEYFNNNPDKYSRISSVDVKAIYCLRLKKVPIRISLKNNNTTIGKMDTYYSMISNEFNVFECPICSSLSNKGNGFKLHIDPDYIYVDDDADEMDEFKRAVGCDDCMVQCRKCGRWHFQFKHYDRIVESGYRLSKKRMFLENYVKKPKAKVEHYCSCGEYLSWIYDELSLHSRTVNKKTYQYYSKIVDKFNTTQCKLVFVNQSTGEAIANHEEFRNFLGVYIGKKIPKKSKEIYDVYKEISGEKDWVINFINKFETAQLKDDVSQGDDSQNAFDIRKTIAAGIDEYKRLLADEYHIDREIIKVTSSENCTVCKTCGKLYCSGEKYFNSVDKQCHSCSEATKNNYRWWVRTSDNTMFYYSEKKGITVRTIMTSKGEELYDEWVKSINKRIIEKFRRRRER